MQHQIKGNNTMKIKIAPANADKINAALREVNGKATSFTIVDFSDLISYAQDAEKMLLARGINKKNQIGISVSFTPAGPSASAYKYASKSTQVTLSRHASGWFLTGITGTTVRPLDKEHVYIKLSREQLAIAHAAVFAGMVVNVDDAAMAA